MRNALLFSVVVLILIFAACSTETTTAEGCKTNADCKMNRVCIEGKCVFPGDIDIAENEGEAEIETSDEEGESQSQLCDSLCGELNTCGLLNQDSPYGKDFSMCHNWCMMRKFGSVLIDCVINAECDETAIENCFEQSECTTGKLEIGNVVQGDTSNTANNAEDASACESELSFPGNDEMWLLHIPAGKTVEINVIGTNFNPALWALDSCGGECIAASDESGKTETLVIPPTDTERYIVIVVDSAVAGAGGVYMLGVNEVSEKK